MIYSDGIHLITDGAIEELHAYAASIGIKRCWWHSGSKWPHYDVPKGRRKDLFAKHPEIVRVDSRRIVAILKNREL